MPKKKARNIFTHPCKSATSWDSAIYEAKQMIQKEKERVSSLKRAIAAFKELRDSGEPFPMEVKEQSEASQ